MKANQSADALRAELAQVKEELKDAYEARDAVLEAVRADLALVRGRLERAVSAVQRVCRQRNGLKGDLARMTEERDEARAKLDLSDVFRVGEAQILAHMEQVKELHAKLAAAEAREARLLPFLRCSRCGKQATRLGNHWSDPIPNHLRNLVCDKCCGHGKGDARCAALSPFPSGAVVLTMEDLETVRGGCHHRGDCAVMTGGSHPCSCGCAAALALLLSRAGGR